MNTCSPRMPVALDLPGGGVHRQKVTPRDVGESLFRDFLNQTDPRGGMEGILSWMSASARGTGAGPEKTEAREAVSKEKVLDFLGQGGGHLMLPADDVSKLAGFLKGQGFSTREIQRLFRSARDGNGGLRLDRLLSGLHALIRTRTGQPASPVVERSDVPRIQEALFKMGLGAEQVRAAVDKAARADGDLSVRRLISALGEAFPNLTPESAKRLESVLQQETGLSFRPGDLREVIRRAGLESSIDRLTGDAPQSVRQAAKQEIAALMREKGIPPQEVKRFLESLRARPGNDGWSREVGTVRDDRLQGTAAVLREDPSIRVTLRKEGNEWEKGGWKQGVLDILNRRDALSRSSGLAPEGGRTAALQDLAGLIEEALSGRAKAKGADHTAHPWFPRSIHKAAASGRDGLLQASTAGGKIVSGAGNDPTRAAGEPASKVPSPAELILPRTEKASAPPQAAPIRTPWVPGPLPEPLPRIVDRMVWMVRAGEQTSRIQISPPELGRLDLDIVIRHGHLHANLNAESPMIKELIEANLQQLRQQLNNLGFVVERFEVTTGLDERRFSESHAQSQGRKGRNRSGRTSGAGDEGEGTQGSAPGRGGNGGPYRIDVHV